MSEIRIYHPYYLWEDFKHGFYDNVSGENKKALIEKVLEMFNDDSLTIENMEKVINEWKYSCEHNLTNNSMNKIAYIGQAACCIYAKVPSTITMEAWYKVSELNRNIADKIALNTINKWKQNQILKNTLKNGRIEATKMEYQMKLQLF